MRMSAGLVCMLISSFSIHKYMVMVMSTLRNMLVQTDPNTLVVLTGF